jgi:predicted GIY-YIG superfamily endonuclease
MDMVLPDNNISFMGFCYVLLSLKNRSSIYIGACNDVAARLKQHNTGYSSATNKIAPSQLQPWALIGFVCGFDHKNQKFVFEKNWQGNVRDILRRNACAEVVELIQVGKDMIIDRVETMPNLRYQACAKLNYEPNSSSGKEMVLEMAAIAEVLHN